MKEHVLWSFMHFGAKLRCQKWILTQLSRRTNPRTDVESRSAEADMTLSETLVPFAKIQTRGQTSKVGAGWKQTRGPFEFQPTISGKCRGNAWNPGNAAEMPEIREMPRKCMKDHKTCSFMQTNPISGLFAYVIGYPIHTSAWTIMVIAKCKQIICILNLYAWRNMFYDPSCISEQNYDAKSES